MKGYNFYKYVDELLNNQKYQELFEFYGNR